MSTSALRRDPHPLREWAAMLDDAQRVLFRAQVGEAPQVLEEMDDLLAAADATPYTDLARTLRFARAVAHQALGDEQSTLEACDALREHAAAHGDRAWMSCAHSTRSDTLTRVGDEERAVADLVTAELLIEGMSHPSLPLATAVNCLAIGYATLRLYEPALAQWRRMAPMLPAVDNTPLPLFHAYNVAEAHTRWALELLRLDRGEEAADHFRAAETNLAAAPPMPTSVTAAEMQASIDLVRGLCQAFAGDPREAERLLGAAYGIVVTFGPDQKAWADLGLARAAQAQGRPADAAARLRPAIGLLDRIGMPQIRLDVGHFDARLHAARLSDPEAVKALDRYARLLLEEDVRRRERLQRSVEQRLHTERINDEYRKLSEQYLTDSDTGLPNRRGLEVRLPELVARAQRENSRLAVVFVQVETAGGAPADAALMRKVADEARPGLRAVDMAARSGPTELVFALPGLRHEDAAAFVGWLRGRVVRLEANGEPQLVAGIAAPRAPSSVAGLIVAADEALRQAQASRAEEWRRAARGLSS